MSAVKSGTQAELNGDDFLNAIQEEPRQVEVKAGVFVTVRPLLFAEAQQVAAQHKGDGNAIAFAALTLGLVSPQLTPEQIERLRQSPAGPIMKAAKAIMELSGMIDDAPNSDGAGSGS